MARVKRAVNAAKKRRTTLERAEGYRGQRSRLYRKAKEQVTHSLVYAYRDRRKRKGDFRRLWIQRINVRRRACQRPRDDLRRRAPRETATSTINASRTDAGYTSRSRCAKADPRTRTDGGNASAKVRGRSVSCRNSMIVQKMIARAAGSVRELRASRIANSRYANTAYSASPAMSPVSPEPNRWTSRPATSMITAAAVSATLRPAEEALVRSVT